MTIGAQLAVRDFARLSGEAAFTLYGERFLRMGAAAWPERLRERYSGLLSWRGVADLKQRLNELAGAAPGSTCLLANRSASLLKMAGRQMQRRCRRVLMADLCWPQYRAKLRRLLEPAVECVTQRLRTAVLKDGIGSDELIDRIARVYRSQDCDGVFLPAVSHDGIRVPVDAVVRRLQGIRPVAFAISDASQALAHVADELGADQCDVVISGTHKWLGAGMPMGVAFLASRAANSIEVRSCDDPLLIFTSQIVGRRGLAPIETVNVWPLIACAGALDCSPRPQDVHLSFLRRLENGRHVKAAAERFGWKVCTHRLPSGILLAQQRDAGGHGDVRDYFARWGVSLSTLEDRVVRMAMPSTPFSIDDASLLAAAFSGAQSSGLEAVPA
jgi:hypothetical protein